MRRQVNRLSVKEVQTKKEPDYYPDGNGLYLVVSVSGAKTWSFIYSWSYRRIIDDKEVIERKQHELGLGSYPLISLVAARAERDKYRELLFKKINPLEARKADKTKAVAIAMTFEKCAEAYIKSLEAGWTSEKSPSQWRNTLKKYTYSIFGNRPVQEIDLDLIKEVLVPIWETKPETAARTRSRIERILDWAKVNGYRTGENPARWRGHLDKLMLPRSKIQKVRHHPSLSHEKIGDFVIRLQKHNGVDARALEFTILTACRTNEVTKAKWEEIDFEKKIWTIPTERMKMKREHRVPLSERALAILERMIDFKADEARSIGATEVALEGWIFPGLKKPKSLSNGAMLALLERINHSHITVHGFRSTFRTWAAAKTPIAREVAEAALAHATDDKVEGAYQRDDFISRRRPLMHKWAEYCFTPSVKENDRTILPFRARNINESKDARRRKIN